MEGKVPGLWPMVHCRALGVGLHEKVLSPQPPVLLDIIDLRLRVGWPRLGPLLLMAKGGEVGSP